MSRLKASKISDSLALDESYSIASSKAAKSLEDNKAERNQGAWTSITLINTWVNVGGSPAGYRVDEFGIVHLRGKINVNASTSALGTADSGVPNPNNTSGNVFFAMGFTNVAGTTEGASAIFITSTGILSVGTGFSRTDKIISLDGVSYEEA